MQYPRNQMTLQEARQLRDMLSIIMAACKDKGIPDTKITIDMEIDWYTTVIIKIPRHGKEE